jgi:hypothetical protein
MASAQQLFNAPAGSPVNEYAAAGAFVMPAWLAAAASSGAAWVPAPQHGWRAIVEQLWAGFSAIPVASLLVTMSIAYTVLHVSHSAWHSCFQLHRLSSVSQHSVLGCSLTPRALAPR